MRVAVYRSEHGGHRGRHLADAMYAGFRRHGLKVSLIKEYTGVVHGDIAVAYGWRNHAAFQAYKKRGGHFLYLDLGYWLRKPVGQRWDGYHKVVLDAWCPTATMKRGCPGDRFNRLGIPVKSGERGQSIVVAGMSRKSAEHHGYRFEQWENKIIQRMRGMTSRPIIYRPKPSKEAGSQGRPIEGALFDSGAERHIDGQLPSAHAVVTHHSNAAIDAIAAGLPVYCEAGVGRLLSVPTLADIDAAEPAPLKARQQLLCDVAYCQWTPGEMRAGDCWAHYRELL